MTRAVNTPGSVVGVGARVGATRTAATVAVGVGRIGVAVGAGVSSPQADNMATIKTNLMPNFIRGQSCAKSTLILGFNGLPVLILTKLVGKTTGL